MPLWYLQTVFLEKTEGVIINGQPRKTGNMRYGTQDEDKQSKNTTQYMLDTAMLIQTQIT